MPRGSSNQHQSSVRNQNHASSGRGRNQMSSQPNHQCASNERIHVPAYTGPALPNHPDIFAPGQHAELRITRAPLPEMESYPYYSETSRDPTYAYRDVEAPQQEISPGRGGEDVVPSTSIQMQLERYGCYSIPSSRAIMTYPVGQCLPTLYEDFLHVQNNAYHPSCLYPKADEPSIFHEQSNAFPSCLYPKQVKIKLNVRPVEKPPEPMEIGEMVKPRDRNVRVSLMASAASPEQISFKLLHEEPVLEPEPENIEMPLELMPSPPPPEEVVEVKLLPMGDSHKAHAKQHFRSCLGVSSVVMRALGIGAYVGLAMAHQFAVYSVKVLKNGLHVYGPIVAKATVSSYKGLRKGSKVFLHKSAPIANHAKNVTLAHIRKTRERCAQEMMKQCLACFASNIDAEDELESFEEIQQPGSNRPSHYDNELAWKDSLRLYPEPKEESESKPDSEANCSREECMAENSQDKPTPELSVLEDYPYYSHKRDCTSPHNKKTLGRLSTRNSDNMSSIVPFKGAGSGNSPYSLSRFRTRMSLSPVRNNQRANFRTQGLGALVWPRPDIRRFSDPLRGHQFISNLAVRPGTKNYRDLIQEPPLEDEVIWRRTLRAYFPEKGAEVRPEDVLLCRQAVPIKLLSKEEFERNKEDLIMQDRCGRLGLGCYPYYSDNHEAGELSYPSYSKRQPDYQHIKRPLLQSSHGDKIVHHCVPKRKPRTHVLPNRGKDNKQLGHSSLAHLKHGEFGSVAKSHDHNEKLMRNEASSGISSIHSRMKDGDFWQANPIHSSESNWKGLPASEAPHPHGKKRPHSPQSDSMEELPHSPEAVEKSDNSSRAHPHGKHQKLEVLSAPESLIQAKFSKRPLRIGKRKISSDSSKLGPPAESRQSGTPLKTKYLDSQQSTPLKGRPPFHIPKVSQTIRKSLVNHNVRSAHIAFTDKPSHSIPSSPGKSFDHQIPSDLRLRSPDPFPRGRKPLFINGRYYRRIHPQPSEKPHERNSRTPRMGDGDVSHTSSMRQPSADDFERKRRFFYKRPRSRAPFKSYTADVHSEGKSKPSLFKNGLSFLRDSLSPQILRKPSAREDDTYHPSTPSSFWNLPLKGKFRFFTLKKSRPAPRPRSPRTPPAKIHDHPNVGEISHGKKRDQGLTPLPSQGSQKSAKRRPLYENIPRLKIFLSKKDPHGIRSLSQRKCRQHGTVLRIKSPKKNLPSARGDKRTKTTSKLLKSRKKDVPQVSPRSCISFPYPIAAAKRKPVDGNVRRRSSSKNQPKKTANSQVTPSSPGKTSKWPNTEGAMARSLSPSPSKRGRKVQFQNPLKSQHRYDNYAPLGSELSSINGNDTSYKDEGQIPDMHSEGTSKLKPDGAAIERDSVENLSPAAVSLSPVQDTIESVQLDNTNLKPASTTGDTSKSAVLQPSEMMIDISTIAHLSVDSDEFLDKCDRDKTSDNSTNSSRHFEVSENFRLFSSKPSHYDSTASTDQKAQFPNNVVLPGDKDGDDSSSDTPYQLNPEISKLLTSYRQVLIKEARKEAKPSSTGRLESEPVQDSGAKLQSEADAAPQPYQKPSNFDEPMFSPLSELFQDVNQHTPESPSKETLNFDAAFETSLPDSFKEGIESIEPQDEQKSDVDHTGEGKGESIALENFEEQKRGVDHAGEGEGALENYHRTLLAHLHKHEQRDELHFYSPDEMNLSPTDNSFAESGQQDRGADHAGEGDSTLENHHRTLPAQLDKHEQRDEIHFYSPDEMNLSPTDNSYAESGQQDRGVDHAGEGDSTLENHHRTLPAQLDKHEQRDETHFYSPDEMNLSPTDNSFAESGQQDRGADHAGEGDSTLENHHRTFPAQLDKHEQRDETHFYSPDEMNLSPTDNSFAESGQQNRAVDHAGEGDGALESHHRTLPAHLHRHEQNDETHFYLPDGMNLSPTDHSFAESGQQNRGVDHAGEGDGALENHQPKFPAHSDKHEREDKIHFSSPVGMNLSPADHSFANSGKVAIDGELFQTLEQPKDVYGQQYLGHLNKGHDQDEKSPASLTIDAPLDESHVDQRLPPEHHNIILEYITIIRGVHESPQERQAHEGHDQGEKSSASLSIDQSLALPTETPQLFDQTPLQSNDVSNPRLFDVEIVTPDKIIFDSYEYEEPGHGTKDEGQMSMITDPVDNQGKVKIEQVEGDSHLGSPTSRSPYSNQDDSENSSSSSMKIIKRTIIEGDRPRKEKRKAWEVVSSADEELVDSARRSLSPLKINVKDYDNGKHKTPNELGNQSPSLVRSEIQQEIHYQPNALAPVEKDDSLYRQELQVDRQEEPEDVNSLTPHQLHGAIQIDKDQEYEEPVKPEHHRKLVAERDEADYQAPEERGKFFQNMESTYHQMPQVGDEEDERQSSVSSGSQRSNTERDTTPRSAMIDENFPKLKFSEKLAAWEMLAQAYEPPAKHQGPSDDMTTVVKVTSKQDQSSLESRQVSGLDLAKPSTEQASKLQRHFDYENSTAHPKRTKETLELSRQYSAEEESQLTTNDQSLIISEEDQSQPSSRVERTRDDHEYAEDFPTLKSESDMEKNDVYLRGISGHVDERLPSKNVHNIILESTTTIRGLQESPLERQAHEGYDQGEKSSASLSIDQPFALPTEIFQLLDQTPPPLNDVSKPRLFDVEIEIVEEIIFDIGKYGEQGHKTKDEGHVSMAAKDVNNQGIEKIEQVEGDSHLGSPSSRSPYSNQDDSENFSSSSEKLLKRTIIEGDRPRKEKRKAWEVVSSVEQELDDAARSLPPLKMGVEDNNNSGFESESNSGALEEIAEKILGSSLDSGILVSPQSLSESYETASEQGFATTSDSEGEVHRSRSFEGLLSESGTSSPSLSFEKNFAPPTRSRRSVFTRPALKKSLIRTSGNEQTFAALQQLEKNSETPATIADSSPGGSSSQGSSGGTSTLPARSGRSLLIRPVLKKSLVQNVETEQMFAQLASEKNYQLDEPPSDSIEDNARNKQINNIREAGVRRSSSFDGLGGSSDGKGSGRAPKRRSFFVRPVLKKSLVASDETEQTFSRIRSEQSEDDLRFDAKDDERESGYQSDTLLDESRPESRSSSPSTPRGSDENVIPRASSRKRKSLFMRPLLKQSLVATLETEELFSRLQAKQNEDTRNEEGFDTGAERGIRRSASFEGITGSDSPNSFQGSDEILMPARPRKSLFTRPILKQSLVANTETEKIFAQLQSQQKDSEDHLSHTEQRLDTREGGGVRRSSGFKGPTGLKDPVILNEMSVPRRGPRGSLFVRPQLRSSLIATLDRQEEDEVGLSGSSSFKDGLESGVSSQLSEGTSNFSPDRSEESEGKTRWEDLPRRDRLDQPRRSALKRSIVGTLNAEQSTNEQTIRSRVKFDSSFTEDTSGDSGARSSASEASETFET